MFKLPKDLINMIYEYDCTKRENFDKVFQELSDARKFYDEDDDIEEYGENNYPFSQLMLKQWPPLYSLRQIIVKQLFNKVLQELSDDYYIKHDKNDRQWFRTKEGRLWW